MKQTQPRNENHGLFQMTRSLEQPSEIPTWTAPRRKVRPESDPTQGPQLNLFYPHQQSLF